MNNGAEDGHRIAQTAGSRLQKMVNEMVPNAPAVQVIEAGIREEDNWWYVPVQPVAVPHKLSEYYEALTEAETQLADEDHLNVLFIPTLPNE